MERKRGMHKKEKKMVEEKERDAKEGKEDGGGEKEKKKKKEITYDDQEFDCALVLNQDRRHRLQRPHHVISVQCSHMVDVLERRVVVNAVAVADWFETFRPEGSFCVNVNHSASAVLCVFVWQLGCDAQGVADLRLARPPLAVKLGDGLAVEAASEHRVELLDTSINLKHVLLPPLQLQARGLERCLLNFVCGCQALADLRIRETFNAIESRRNDEERWRGREKGEGRIKEEEGGSSIGYIKRCQWQCYQEEARRRAASAAITQPQQQVASTQLLQ